MDSNLKGSLTEILCASAFMALGYQVSLPFGGHASYDFVVDINHKLYKVQVKTAQKEEDLISFDCRRPYSNQGTRSRTKYSSEEVDFFATYYDNQCYLVPLNECSTEKRLRFVPPRSGQIKGISFAKDYKVEEVLKRY